MIMSKEKLKKSIREIPDFPIPGILFYDVTTLFKDPERLQELSDIMYRITGFYYGSDSRNPPRSRIHTYP